MAFFFVASENYIIYMNSNSFMSNLRLDFFNCIISGCRITRTVPSTIR